MADDMSILSGLELSEKQMEGALEIAARITAEVLDDPVFKNDKFVALLSEGFSVADILQIPDEQLDAAFAYGHRLLASGETAKARDIFSMLCQVQPLEERYTYALAATHQVCGDFRTAGRLYVLFLSLDAASVEGRLRLAECFLGAGERDNAVAMFESAAAEAQDDETMTEQYDYAKGMIDHAKGK